MSVVVTGLGMITGLGTDLEQTWAGICKGQSAVQDIADVNGEHALGALVKDYNPRRLLPDKKLAKSISRQDVIGIYAAMAALQDSGFAVDGDDDVAYRSGLYVASPGNKYEQQYDFMPAMAAAKADMQTFAEQVFAQVSPLWLLRTLPNNVLAYAGILSGFKGANHNFTNHIAGAVQAMLEAKHAIDQGVIDRALIVAYDRGPEAQGLAHFSALGLLSDSQCQPFAEPSGGTILGEAAAALLLERDDLARERGATIYGELVAGAVTGEASGALSMDETGAPLQELISQVLQAAQINAADIAAVTAHGNGVALSDRSEAKALAAHFADSKVPMTAYKWATGHTLVAAPVLETLLSLRALHEGFVPGIANLSTTHCAPGLQLSADMQAISGSHALIIARGFAGLNGAVVVKHALRD